MATCVQCGGAFQRAPDEGWKKLCVPCWKAKRDAETANAIRLKTARLESELLYWREEALRWKRLFIELSATTGQRRNSLDLEREFRDQLPRLLHVAHPDRHGNSLAATKATQWLLTVRERLQ
jgi:hypothetical protein